MKFKMLKLVLEKAEEPEIIANIRWIMEKARDFQKNIYFCFIGGEFRMQNTCVPVVEDSC